MDQGEILRVSTSAGNYHIVSNEPANDERLSWEARGILSYLLSKPDTWICRNKDLERKGPAGQKKIKRCLKELQDHGYVNRTRANDEDGKLYWVTNVYESPSLNPTYGGTSKPSPQKGTMVPKSINGKGTHIVSTEEVITKKTILCNSCKKAIVDNEGDSCSLCSTVSEMLSVWGDLFPDKPQPRPATYRDKIRSRMKDSGFRSHWKEALVRASKIQALHEKSWFGFRFFVKNDDSWLKCYEGYYSFLDEKRAGSNGHGGAADSAWAKVSEVVAKYGRYQKPLFDDDQIAQAVSIMGWNNICDMPDGEGKKMFGEIYAGLVHRHGLNEKLGSTW